MILDSGFRHLFSLFFFIVAMILTRGQDWLKEIISSFSKEFGLTDLSLTMTQVQRVVLGRGIPGAPLGVGRVRQKIRSALWFMVL